MRRCVCIGAFVWCLALPAAAAAQETVRITVPAGASFAVTNVTTTTTAPAVRVNFDSLVLLPGRRLKISVRADAATFERPGSTGLAIQATNVSWTTSSAAGGTGSSGTLSSTAYTTLFLSDTAVLSGGVDVTWSLGAPGGGIRSGSHTLVVRYRIEGQ